MDYDKDTATTRNFFAKVQNKLHFAIHRHTAAALVMERADSERVHMGLTTWENSPDGKILKSDVSVAKNYLNQEELEARGRIVNAYLDLAEKRARRKIPMTMQNWANRLDAFLEFADHAVLQDAGTVTMRKTKEYGKVNLINFVLFRIDSLKVTSTGCFRTRQTCRNVLWQKNNIEPCPPTGGMTYFFHLTNDHITTLVIPDDDTQNSHSSRGKTRQKYRYISHCGLRMLRVG